MCRTLRLTMSNVVNPMIAATINNSITGDGMFQIVVVGFWNGRPLITAVFRTRHANSESMYAAGEPNPPC
jgi:hypothetical protein